FSPINRTFKQHLTRHNMSATCSHSLGVINSCVGFWHIQPIAEFELSTVCVYWVETFIQQLNQHWINLRIVRPNAYFMASSTNLSFIAHTPNHTSDNLKITGLSIHILKFSSHPKPTKIKGPAPPKRRKTPQPPGAGPPRKAPMQIPPPLVGKLVRSPPHQNLLL